MRILEIFGANNDTRQDVHTLAALPTVPPILAELTAIFLLFQQRFLLQILLLAQHISGTTMPIS